MKNLTMLFILLYVSVNTFSQTNMIIKKSDNTTISIPISEIDSIFYSDNYFICGDQITDFDGNSYNTVEIGGQCWLSENLNVTHYPNGDAIPLVTSDSEWGVLLDNNTDDAYSYYNNNTDGEAELYGAFYTYAAAIGDNWEKDNEDNQGVCPDGWHLPNNEEWDALNNHLGANAGSQLASGENLWLDGDLEEHENFNTSGFHGLPTGRRYYDSGLFNHFSIFNDWWSADEFSNSNAHNRYLVYNSTSFNSNNVQKSFGFSVRCIKNND